MMTKKRLNLRRVVKTVAYLTIVVMFVACDKNNGDDNGTGTGGEKGVVINGVRWATRNVGAKGTFVTKPEDYGDYL